MRHYTSASKGSVPYACGMATIGKPTTRNRIPKLSEKPEPGTGRYYTSYRAAGGSARRQRFTKDRKESEQLYRRWVIEHYDDSVDIIVRDGSSLNAAHGRTLPHIANDSGSSSSSPSAVHFRYAFPSARTRFVSLMAPSRGVNGLRRRCRIDILRSYRWYG